MAQTRRRPEVVLPRHLTTQLRKTTWRCQAVEQRTAPWETPLCHWLSACAFCRPCDSLPRLLTSKSTPHTVQRARSFFPRTGESQDLNRSSESHSVGNLHFPISSKASRGDPRNAKKILRPSQEKRNTIKSIPSAFFVVYGALRCVWRPLHARVDVRDLHESCNCMH